MSLSEQESFESGVSSLSNGLGSFDNNDRHMDRLETHPFRRPAEGRRPAKEFLPGQTTIVCFREPCSSLLLLLLYFSLWVFRNRKRTKVFHRKLQLDFSKVFGD